eukprot:596681-Amphidinium_carterae.1
MFFVKWSARNGRQQVWQCYQFNRCCTGCFCHEASAPMLRSRRLQDRGLLSPLENRAIFCPTDGDAGERNWYLGSSSSFAFVLLLFVLLLLARNPLPLGIIWRDSFGTTEARFYDARSKRFGHS